MHNRIKLLLTIPLIFSNQAIATDNNYKPFMSLEKVIMSLTVKGNGTYDEIIDYTTRIETEQGAKRRVL